jgi:nucleoside-diphosphate-sugar epimerase
MRVVVVGGSGNVGTSTIDALSRDAAVCSILGVARRLPEWKPPKTEWAQADVVTDDLVPLLKGADVVIHLAWLIQPSRDGARLRAVNVDGSRRLFRAVADAGVPALVYASSVGAYSAGPKDRAVDESWPTEGVATSFYSRHKAEVERMLDRFEAEHSSIRVVRLRPALIFKGDAAEEVRRLFAGPFLPTFLLHPRVIPFVPRIAGLRFQAVHSLDIGQAYRLAATSDAGGAFNIAAEPVLGPPELAEALDARQLSLPAPAVRALTWATWQLRLQPTPPGWLDMALGVPIMDTSRARGELGWEPRYSSSEALLELLEGMRTGRGMPTPPLDPDAGEPARMGEIKRGVGTRP